MRTRVLRGLSLLMLVAALAATVAMVLWDLLLKTSGDHGPHAALPLILIGLSYGFLQLSAVRPPVELVKGLLLGLAFVLWGVELLLPNSFLVTFLDCAVVSIFVLDLGAIIVEHLRRRDQQLP